MRFSGTLGLDDEPGQPVAAFSYVNPIGVIGRPVESAVKGGLHRLNRNILARRPFRRKSARISILLSAAFHKYGDAPRAARRPPRKARGGRIPRVLVMHLTQVAPISSVPRRWKITREHSPSSKHASLPRRRVVRIWFSCDGPMGSVAPGAAVPSGGPFGPCCGNAP